jgi:hypothetical protein
VLYSAFAMERYILSQTVSEKMMAVTAPTRLDLESSVPMTNRSVLHCRDCCRYDCPLHGYRHHEPIPECRQSAVPKNPL